MRLLPGGNEGTVAAIDSQKENVLCLRSALAAIF
jgi:hypothetical protein